MSNKKNSLYLEIDSVDNVIMNRKENENNMVDTKVYSVKSILVAHEKRIQYLEKKLEELTERNKELMEKLE